MRCFLSGWGGSCAEVRRPHGRGDAENELQSYTTVWAVLDGGGVWGAPNQALGEQEEAREETPGRGDLSAEHDCE